MREIYRSRVYAPDRVALRYLEYLAPGSFLLHEALANGLTLRTLHTDAKDVPLVDRQTAACLKAGECAQLR